MVICSSQAYKTTFCSAVVSATPCWSNSIITYNDLNVWIDLEMDNKTNNKNYFIFGTTRLFFKSKENFFLKNEQDTQGPHGSFE